MTTQPTLKESMHDYLRAARSGLLDRVDGLGEYDLRRPMTPTGTNLLGLVKHLAGLEFGYLGSTFGRPPAEELPWIADKSIWQGADMWATPAESSGYLLDAYRAGCDHADATITALELDAPGTVSWWSEGSRDTTLGVIMTRMISETSQHAGHADIVRELIDGRTSTENGEVGDADWWADWHAKVQAAADPFK
ncbi:DinB family protein [Microlunatus speluncae]|uniref:DinB family protein n=1 Tax=Microlunatus speluncae TaxID=2594267 RepID=UPI0015819557|nr:DinB family protein [Microlunatus speluncae]